MSSPTGIAMLLTQAQTEDSINQTEVIDLSNTPEEETCNGCLNNEPNQEAHYGGCITHTGSRWVDDDCSEEEFSDEEEEANIARDMYDDLFDVAMERPPAHHRLESVIMRLEARYSDRYDPSSVTSTPERLSTVTRRGSPPARPRPARTHAQRVASATAAAVPVERVPLIIPNTPLPTGVTVIDLTEDSDEDSDEDVVTHNPRRRRRINFDDE